MKEIAIIIVILLIIFSAAFCMDKYLDSTSSSLIYKLDNLELEMIELNKTENNKREEIIKEIEEIKKEWDRTENGWAIVVLHEELDKIETSFLELESSIKYGELYEALKEIKETKFLVQHIVEKEKFDLKNIF